MKKIISKAIVVVLLVAFFALLVQTGDYVNAYQQNYNQCKKDLARDYCLKYKTSMISFDDENDINKFSCKIMQGNEFIAKKTKTLTIFEKRHCRKAV